MYNRILEYFIQGLFLSVYFVILNYLLVLSGVLKVTSNIAFNLSLFWIVIISMGILTVNGFVVEIISMYKR